MNSKKLQAAPKAAAKKPAKRVQPGDEELSKSGAPKKPGQLRKGETANPAGRPPGAKNVLTEAKVKYLSMQGQTPLEFLTAVYRDQLYDEYETEVVDEKRGIAHVYPKLDPITGDIIAKKIPVDLQQRIAAATSAAPYVHRKKPIGIDGGEGKPVSFVSAAQLAKLSDDELDKLLQVLGKLQIGAEFEGGEQRPYDLGVE